MGARPTISWEANVMKQKAASVKVVHARSPLESGWLSTQHHHRLTARTCKPFTIAFASSASM